MLHVRNDEMRPVDSHSLDADVKIRAADIHANRFHTRFVQPFRRPGIAAAAIEQHVAVLHFQERNGRPKQLDEIKRVVGVVRVERRRISRAEKIRIVDVVLDGDLRLLVRDALVSARRRRRGCRVSQTADQIGWKRRGAFFEQAPVAIAIPEIVREQLWQGARHRKPAGALKTDQQSRLHLDCIIALRRRRVRGISTKQRADRRLV